MRGAVSIPMALRRPPASLPPRGFGRNLTPPGLRLLAILSAFFVGHFATCGTALMITDAFSARVQAPVHVSTQGHEGMASL